MVTLLLQVYSLVLEEVEVDLTLLKAEFNLLLKVEAMEDLAVVQEVEMVTTLMLGRVYLEKVMMEALAMEITLVEAVVKVLLVFCFMEVMVKHLVLLDHLLLTLVEAVVV